MPLLNATLIFAEVDAGLGGNASIAELLAATAVVLEDKFGPTASPGKHTEWYICSAFLAVELVAMLLAIIVRVWIGNAWLFRRMETMNGTYLTPNFNFTWQCAVALFLAALQVATWFLLRFSEGDNIRGFYACIVVVWLGFLAAALSCAFALAVSRCRDLATANPLALRWYHSPHVVHLVFLGYPLAALVVTAVLGALLSQKYRALWDAIVTLLEQLELAAAQSAAGTDISLADQVSPAQTALDHFDSFYWHFEAAFYNLMAHDLVTWIICLAVAVPYMLRLGARLYRKEVAGGAVAPGHARRELVVAFGAACAAVFLLSLACIIYFLLVLIMVGFHVHPSTFVDDAYNVVTIALLIFVALGISVCALALSHALLQLRQHRRSHTTAGHRAGLPFGASTFWAPARVAFPTDTTTLGSPPSSPNKGSLRRGFPLKRDRGRFTITIERVVDRGTADLDLEGLELGESVAGAEEERAGHKSWDGK